MRLPRYQSALGHAPTHEEKEQRLAQLQYAASMFKHDLHRGETRYSRAVTKEVSKEAAEVASVLP